MKRDPKIGDILIDLNNYELGNIIGEGSFGVVFEATDKETDNTVALKVLRHKDELLRKKGLENIIRELLVPLKLKLPGIVTLLGFRFPLTKEEKSKEKVKEITAKNAKGKNVKVDMTNAIFVSELMPNGSLESLNDQYLRSKGEGCENMNPTIRSKIIFGIAATMSKVHQAKVIHRDLKLENIFLDDKLEPRIADFGLAKCITNNIQMTSAIGTPLYMAPELYDLNDDDDDDEEKRPYSFPVDVYAFAFIMYLMFRNKVIFPDGQMPKARHQYMMRILKGDRPARPETIPDIYWDLIQSCWDRDPDKRPTFQDITELLKDDKYAINEYDMKTNIEQLHEYQKRIEADVTEDDDEKGFKYLERKNKFTWKRH